MSGDDRSGGGATSPNLPASTSNRNVPATNATADEPTGTAPVAALAIKDALGATNFGSARRRPSASSVESSTGGSPPMHGGHDLYTAETDGSVEENTGTSTSALTNHADDEDDDDLDALPTIHSAGEASGDGTTADGAVVLATSGVNAGSTPTGPTNQATSTVTTATASAATAATEVASDPAPEAAPVKKRGPPKLTVNVPPQRKTPSPVLPPPAVLGSHLRSSFSSFGSHADHEAPQDGVLDGSGGSSGSSQGSTGRGGQAMLRALAVDVVATYSTLNPEFRYSRKANPRRSLTQPSEGTLNNGADNKNGDYVLYVNDVLGFEQTGYVVLDLLGSGTFGQVVKCRSLLTGAIVAVKVVKNKPAYFRQAMLETQILETLNSQLDPNNTHNIVRLLDTFVHRHHLCLVFELLSVNLYELLKQNHFRGLSLTLVRVFFAQILHAMTLLAQARIIHCDLKPENVLLTSTKSAKIKVIDFGSACFDNQAAFSYIQSRFYRSPEVLLGLPYTASIDVWSLGCIAAELFLGIPVLPGANQFHQMARIVAMFGNPPMYMLERGKHTSKYFVRVPPGDGEDANGRGSWRIKTPEEYAADTKTDLTLPKKYFNYESLPDIVLNYPMKPETTEAERGAEMAERKCFVHFLLGMLRIDPLQRWSSFQALKHPFITKEEFDPNYEPPRLATLGRTEIVGQPAQSTSAPHEAGSAMMSRSYAHATNYHSPQFHPPAIHHQAAGGGGAAAAAAAYLPGGYAPYGGFSPVSPSQFSMGSPSQFSMGSPSAGRSSGGSVASTGSGGGGGGGGRASVGSGRASNGSVASVSAERSSPTTSANTTTMQMAGRRQRRGRRAGRKRGRRRSSGFLEPKYPTFPGKNHFRKEAANIAKWSSPPSAYNPPPEQQTSPRQAAPGDASSGVVGGGVAGGNNSGSAFASGSKDQPATSSSTVDPNAAEFIPSAAAVAAAQAASTAGSGDAQGAAGGEGNTAEHSRRRWGHQRSSSWDVQPSHGGGHQPPPSFQNHANLLLMQQQQQLLQAHQAQMDARRLSVDSDGVGGNGAGMGGGGAVRSQTGGRGPLPPPPAGQHPAIMPRGNAQQKRMSLPAINVQTGSIPEASSGFFDGAGGGSGGGGGGGPNGSRPLTYNEWYHMQQRLQSGYPAFVNPGGGNYLAGFVGNSPNLSTHSSTSPCSSVGADWDPFFVDDNSSPASMSSSVSSFNVGPGAGAGCDDSWTMGGGAMGGFYDDVGGGGTGGAGGYPVSQPVDISGGASGGNLAAASSYGSTYSNIYGLSPVTPMGGAAVGGFTPNTPPQQQQQQQHQQALGSQGAQAAQHPHLYGGGAGMGYAAGAWVAQQQQYYGGRTSGGGSELSRDSSSECLIDGWNPNAASYIPSSASFDGSSTIDDEFVDGGDPSAAIGGGGGGGGVEPEFHWHGRPLHTLPEGEVDNGTGSGRLSSGPAHRKASDGSQHPPNQFLYPGARSNRRARNKRNRRKRFFQRTL